MCGYFIHDKGSFTRQEKTILEVRGKGEIKLVFNGKTPFYDDGAYYCCFGNYDELRKELVVKIGREND